jgi:hypothetical protein
MQSEFYPFQSDDDRLYFQFLSVSPTKTIKKAVIFTPLAEDRRQFNLALLDILPDGRLCDETISDNHDLLKVMATVSKCITDFFERYPTAQIYIEGNSPARTRLYRIIISRELSKITKIYQVYGTFGLTVEPFEPNKYYQTYLLNLKSDENDNNEKH